MDEVTPQQRPGCDPRLFDPVPLGAVAREIGVSLRTLQRWVKGDAEAYRPQLAHVSRGGKVLVRPIVAYEHLLRHAARGHGLRPPAGYVGPDEAVQVLAEQADGVAQGMGAESPKEFLLSFLSGTRQATPVEINAYVNVVNSLVRAAEVEAKSARRYELRDLLAAVEDVRDLYVTALDGMTVRASLKLKTLLAEHFGVRLSAYANAQAVIQNVIVDECESSAVWIRGEVKRKLDELEAKDVQ